MGHPLVGGTEIMSGSSSNEFKSQQPIVVRRLLFGSNAEPFVIRVEVFGHGSISSYGFNPLNLRCKRKGCQSPRQPTPPPTTYTQACSSDGQEDEAGGFGGGCQEKGSFLVIGINAVADNLPRIVDGVCEFQCPAGGNQRVQVSHFPIAIEEGVLKAVAASGAVPHHLPAGIYAVCVTFVVVWCGEAYQGQSLSHYCRGRRG